MSVTTEFVCLWDEESARTLGVVCTAVTNLVLGSEVWSEGETGEDIHGEADEDI